MLYVVFIVLGSFLQIIYTDKSILFFNFFKSLHYHRHIILKTQNYIAQKLPA